MQTDLCCDDAAVVSPRALSAADEALLWLGGFLRDQSYRFTTTTPLTHSRVVQRGAVDGTSLTRVFGWSLPFSASDLPAEVLQALALAKALAHSNGLLRSKVRFSTLNDQIYAHSAFPTDAADSVFFGPDTYRFARCIESVLNSQPPSYSAPRTHRHRMRQRRRRNSGRKPVEARRRASTRRHQSRSRPICPHQCDA